MMFRPGVPAVAILLLAVPCLAQTNERIYEKLDFRFVTPGARAMGMGQAFVGLADDATAANSNPAGLSNLLEPEFAVEFNATRIRHRRFIPGAVEQTHAFGETVLSPSFFSYGLPLRRATLLFFRNTVQAFRERFVIPPRFIPELAAPEDGAFGTIAATVENYGVGGSFVIGPRLSVGGSVVLSDLDLATEGRSGEQNQPRNGTTTIDHDRKWTAIAGVLVKPSPRVSVGAAYYGGSTFNLTTTLFGDFLNRGIDLTLTGETRPVDYVVPDRVSVGAAWRPRNDLTIVGDVARVRYSRQITDRFLVVDFQDPDAGLSRRNFSIPDVTELHVGVEYRVYRPSMTLAFRGGAFTDPDHQMRFRPEGASAAHVAVRMLAFRFNTVQPGTDRGLTAGAGVALRNHVQVDAAFSASADARQFVVSAVVRMR